MLDQYLASIFGRIDKPFLKSDSVPKNIRHSLALFVCKLLQSRVCARTEINVKLVTHNFASGVSAALNRPLSLP
jgi:hypothetical protein